jgi:hypothetical protein
VFESHSRHALFSLCVILCTGTTKVRPPAQEMSYKYIYKAYDSKHWAALAHTRHWIISKIEGMGHVARMRAVRNATKILI